MVSKKLSGIVFDLEGTLVDGAHDLRHALNQLLRELGRRAATLEEIRAQAEDGLMLLVKRMLEQTGGVPDGDALPYVQKFIALYRTVEPDPAQIFPGVLETLEKMKSAGVAMGICTNKPEVATLHLLQGLNLAHYFNGIAGGDTFQVHKPNPGHVTGLLKLMKAPAEGCVMIGDSTKDVLAAHGAGIPCIICDNFGVLEANDLGAEAKINNLRELPEVLAKIGLELN